MTIEITKPIKVVIKEGGKPIANGEIVGYEESGTINEEVWSAFDVSKHRIVGEITAKFEVRSGYYTGKPIFYNLAMKEIRRREKCEKFLKRKKISCRRLGL